MKHYRLNQPVAKATRLNLILRAGFAPVTVEFVNPTVCSRLDTHHNTILLADDRHCAALLLEKSCSAERVNRLARKLIAPGRRDVLLKEPVVAMQVVEPGESWPADYQAGPNARFVSLPLKQDGSPLKLVEAATTHPLLQQPAGSMWLMGGRNSEVDCEPPLTVNHRDVVGVEQRENRLLVTLRNHPVTHLLVGLADRAAAIGLKNDLEAGRVRLLRYGGLVNELVVFPRPHPQAESRKGYGCLEVSAEDGGLTSRLQECRMFADPQEVAAELTKRWHG